MHNTIFSVRSDAKAAAGEVLPPNNRQLTPMGLDKQQQGIENESHSRSSRQVLPPHSYYRIGNNIILIWYLLFVIVLLLLVLGGD